MMVATPLDPKAEIGQANVFRYSATNQSDHRGGGGRKVPHHVSKSKLGQS